MKKDKKRWIIVQSKITYLWLVTVPIGLIKTFIDYQNLMNVDLPNTAQFIAELFVSLTIIAIGIIMFIKFNTYSQWMNPDHPKE